MRAIILTMVAAILCGAPACAEPRQTPLYVVDEYNPARDPVVDLATASRIAQAQNKNVLLVVGGDWCVWCEILDRFLHANERARTAMTASFIIVKINMSRENANETFLSQYPAPEGYPDFVILAPDGRYLASQNTADLEQGRTYNAQRMIAFAERWRRR